MNNSRKILTAGIAILSVAGIGYMIGFERGRKVERLDALRFNIISGVHLYKVAEAGDQEKLARDLEFLLYASTQDYQKMGGSDANTNFQRGFSAACEISKKVGTNLVSLDFNVK